MIDLTIPEHAYFFGFASGDGHLAISKSSPNKGKFSIELNIRDEDILKRFSSIFPKAHISYRIRSTNFSKSSHTVTWSLSCKEFRDALYNLGLPIGKKSLLIAPPIVSYSVVDYWRGIVDADGSLGITSKGLPFLSLITTSKALAKAYESFLFQITGLSKTTNRNARDKAFNISVFREDAVKVASTLYYSNCLALDRKMKKSKDVCAWIRPNNLPLRKRVHKWTKSEDQIVMNNTVEIAAQILNRPESSVAYRRDKLQGNLLIKDGDQSQEGAA